jgi:hypothetical protein
MTLDDKCDGCNIWMTLFKSSTQRLKEKFNRTEIPGDYLAPIDGVEGTRIIDEGCNHFYVIDGLMYCNNEGVILKKLLGGYKHE